MKKMEEASEPPDLELFEELAEGQLVCRVCGALVARDSQYPRVHWDWHEAANGA